MDEEKESVKYFMESMTQEEFIEVCRNKSNRNDFETGWSSDDRYIFNKIMSDHIQKQDKENG